jgi:hypothetical protein
MMSEITGNSREAPDFQYFDGFFIFRNEQQEVLMDEMTFDEYMQSYLIEHGIETRSEEELLQYIATVVEQQRAAEKLLHRVDYWVARDDPRIRILKREQQDNRNTEADNQTP